MHAQDTTAEIYDALKTPRAFHTPTMKSGPACADCAGETAHVKDVPDGDPNGTTVGLYECDDCGALTYAD